jgi:hypothetical protein
LQRDTERRPRNSDRQFHSQVKINDRVATVARNHQPMMFEVSAAAIVGQNHADFLAESRALNCSTAASIRIGFAVAPHPLDIVADFVITAIVAHCVGPLCQADGRITRQTRSMSVALWFGLALADPREVCFTSNSDIARSRCNVRFVPIADVANLFDNLVGAAQI